MVEHIQMYQNLGLKQFRKAIVVPTLVLLSN